MEIQAMSSERQRKRIKFKLATIFLITFELMGVILLLFFQLSQKTNAIIIFIGAILIYVLLYVIVQFNRVNKAFKLIGNNLMISLEENRIVLKDYVANKEIIVERKWNDIEYIQYTDFRTTTEKIINKYAGLLIVFNSKTFFESLSVKVEKDLKYEMKLKTLSGGFFMECEESVVDYIRKKYGEEIIGYI